MGDICAQLIRDLMAKAVNNKFNTIRFFAFGVRRVRNLMSLDVHGSVVPYDLDDCILIESAGLPS